MKLGFLYGNCQLVVMLVEKGLACNKLEKFVNKIEENLICWFFSLVNCCIVNDIFYRLPIDRVLLPFVGNLTDTYIIPSCGYNRLYMLLSWG